MKSVIGLAGSEREAEQAIKRLVDAGFDTESMSVLRNVGAFWQSLGCTPTKIVARDVVIGAALGLACYALFGVLAAVGEVALGFNTQVARGVLAVFGLLGVLVGGLLGLWFGLGELEDEGRSFVRGIHSGGRLVMVRTADEHAQRAQRVLREADLQAVKICTSDRSIHAELGHAYWATDRLSNRIRWAARGLSVILALVVFGLFAMENRVAGEPPNLGLASLVDDFLMPTLLMTLLGIVLAWHWEGIGAVLIVGSVLLFAGINAIEQGSWHFNVLVLLSVVVAALFGWDWWRSEQTHLHTRPTQHI